jgi:5-methylcytosine-specific restriction endonuclease McrA
LIFDKPVYFKYVVPVQVSGRIVESYVRNDKGGLHGRRFAEDFRVVSEEDFVDLVSGQYFIIQEPERYAEGLVEERIRQRVARESWLRSVKARDLALPIYQFACAITGQKLLSRSGHITGLQVCHVLSVASGGLDICSNLIVLCPDFHIRYDHGSIDILDDYTWIPVGTRHDPVVANWMGPRKLFVPEESSFRLDHSFLAAHRQDVQLRQGTAV